jgi:hypothetical protein
LSIFLFIDNQGAYQDFFAYLNSDPMCKVEGIPQNQLNIASLGRARLEKGYPSAKKLILQGVPKGLATALAPFQRGGVDFVIEKEGRALIADGEYTAGDLLVCIVMDLRFLSSRVALFFFTANVNRHGSRKGKKTRFHILSLPIRIISLTCTLPFYAQTIQGIASMTVYHDEWPVLVLTPSSARYHWEAEFQNWLGAESPINKKQKDSKPATTGMGDDDEKLSQDDSLEDVDESACMELLRDSQIHVMTTSKEAVIPTDSIRVVVCSYGLAPALVENGKIFPGLFKCAIVDESHMLKNISTKRASMLVPVLHATNRCLLLSGTPALSRPAELWPQLKILATERQGWWDDESAFYNNYVRRSSPARRAELHTMLTGTVMIRRLKIDILKSLPNKVREKVVMDISGSALRKEFHQCMVLLREGKGVLGKLARQQNSALTADAMTISEEPSSNAENNFDLEEAQASLTQEMHQRYAEGKNRIQHTLLTTHNQLDDAEKNELVLKLDSELRLELQLWYNEQNEEIQKKKEEVDAQPTRTTVLNHMYTLTAKAKVPMIVDMIKRWLKDPTKGKLCVFAHHLFVLNAIVEQVGLSNAEGSSTKFIRIDGATAPKYRQAQIKMFQNDPSVRIAVLGITAAGVAVTLTAASTVWFTELFWTPALMIQAEDRCHRIGQNARVHCLYFVATGTLDELLWKLLETKFRDLGEFVEGKEKLKLVVDRTYNGVKELCTIFQTAAEVELDDEAGNDEDGELDPEDKDIFEILDFQEDIALLGKQELTMLLPEGDDDEGIVDADAKPAAGNMPSKSPEPVLGRSEEEAIQLSDDEEEKASHGPIASATYTTDEVQLISPTGTFNTDGQVNCRIYKMHFRGPSYGIQLQVFERRLIVSKNFHSDGKPTAGDILVALNGYRLPFITSLKQVLPYLKQAINKPPVELTFAEDPEFATFFEKMTVKENTEPVQTTSQKNAARPMPPSQGNQGDVIDLLDDD